MKPSIYRISLDVHDAHSSVCLDMKRQDTARQIDIALTDGGFPYQISEECYAVFAATKADGKKLLHHCEIRNNIIQYIVRPQTTAAVGPMECEIKLYGAGDKLLMSPGFSILVSENAVTNDEELESEDEVDDLTKLISEATTVITEGKNINSRSEKLIEEMETEKETLEDKAAEAKGAAENAQSMAKSAGNFASDAEKAAYLAQKYSTRPDLSQNNPDEPGYIQNRTHWVESSETVIAWDGNVIGTRTYTDALGKIYYKISDKCPEESDVVGATIEFSDGKILTVSTKMFNGYTGGHAAVGGYIYLRKTPVVYPGNVLDPHDVGVYAAIINDVYPAVFRYGEDVVHTLDEKFIPDTIARKDDLTKAMEDYMAEHPIVPDSGQNPDLTGVEPAEDDIPKVYFTGTLPTSKDDGDVKLTMRYISKTKDFTYPVTLKVQGSSSANYPKKNFTLKPYKDSTYESKKKLAFKNWAEMNKFVLKAHWIDCSHVRNVGTARIWGKIMQSRSDYDSLPEELRNAPNHGATDGFTCKVFCNGVYQGLYEWIVPKDKLFGQDKDIATHSILNSEWNNQLACAFATTSPTMGGNWSEELQDEIAPDISDSFANLIRFVAGSTDAEFVANAENYFDVQSVIDFSIFARVFCIVDNLCRNQIFFTYDGKKWYEGAWDMDAVLGLSVYGGIGYAHNTEYQSGYIAYTDWGITNMLYQRVENLFMDRFLARYAELRKGVLSVASIIEVYERMTDVLTSFDGLLKEDYAETTAGGAFTKMPGVSANNIQQIRNFIAARVLYMDEQINTMLPPVACTGISLNTNTLNFTTDGTQTLIATVTPNDCSYPVTWESDNPSIATVTDGVVTAVANGSCNITAKCGDCIAVCSVAVSGIAEPVLCTGITLSSETLTFDGEGTQTITAMVDPPDTTDALVWTISNPAIASIVVADNVCTVQSVGNGNAVIIVTCGGQTANCSVTVSGIAINILSGSTWNADAYLDERGNIVECVGDKNSDPIDVSEYVGTRILTNGNNVKVLFYDEADKSLGRTEISKSVGVDIPNNAKYMRLSIGRASDLATLKMYTYTENLYDGDSKLDGSYNGTGYNPSDTGSGYTKLTVEPGDSFLIARHWGVTFLDSNDAVLQHSSGEQATEFIAPDGAAVAAFSCADNMGMCLIARDYQMIGQSEMPVTA